MWFSWCFFTFMLPFSDDIFLLFFLLLGSPCESYRLPIDWYFRGWIRELKFFFFFYNSFDSMTNLDSIVWIFTWMILFYRWVCLLIMGTPRMTWSFLPMTVCLLRFVEIYCFIQTSSEFLCKCSILFICLLIDI
jgi:hypothetical protein